MFLTFYQKKQTNVTVAGFTIIELMVTITIVVLVTGIVLLQYSSFNSSVLLTDQAYLTAFDLREAQSLAVSVRGNGSVFREEYGLYFNMSSPNLYLLFQDNDAGSGGKKTPVHYDIGEEIGAPNIVDPRFKIKSIKGVLASGSKPKLNDLAVSFKRPDFDADFYSSSQNNITAAEISFAPLNGSATRTVTISAAGQISVQ